MISMSKPRYGWWGYIKYVIRDYPYLRERYNLLHEQSITANTSGMPGSGGGVSRGVESIAIKELPKPNQLEYDAVRRAVAVTERMRTGNDRLHLIDLVFWKQSHTLGGAAVASNISYDTAVGYHRDFIMLVAFFREMVPYEELSDFQKFTLKSHKDVVKS